MTLCLCYSCQNNKDIAKINFTIDSCTVSHPDIKQITSKINIAMIDIKKWNDTTFLFLIPSNMNSTISLYTYYWDNGFNLLSKYELSDSISNFFLKNQYNSITFINKDSLIAGGNNNFAIIDLKKMKSHHPIDQTKMNIYKRHRIHYNGIVNINYYYQNI